MSAAVSKRVRRESLVPIDAQRLRLAMGGVTVSELARRTGEHQQTLDLIVRGKSKRCVVGRLDKLAAVLGVEPEWLSGRARGALDDYAYWEVVAEALDLVRDAVPHRPECLTQVDGRFGGPPCTCDRAARERRAVAEAIGRYGREMRAHPRLADGEKCGVGAMLKWRTKSIDAMRARAEAK